MNDKVRGGSGKVLDIIHLNVRSLLGGHRADLLKRQIGDSGAGVFTFSETWLTEAIPKAQVEIPNYSVARLDRSWGDVQGKEPKRGGGAALLHKKWY